ncbi:hypothetical protein B0J14DRAFT_273934 [Halenospora varia]|nr:hypothetical protein B0J14DRAFT_273934 [Halenospora varia]
MKSWVDGFYTQKSLDLNSNREEVPQSTMTLEEALAAHAVEISTSAHCPRTQPSLYAYRRTLIAWRDLGDTQSGIMTHVPTSTPLPTTISCFTGPSKVRYAFWTCYIILLSFVWLFKGWLSTTWKVTLVLAVTTLAYSLYISGCNVW